MSRASREETLFRSIRRHHPDPPPARPMSVDSALNATRHVCGGEPMGSAMPCYAIHAYPVRKSRNGEILLAQMRTRCIITEKDENNWGLKASADDCKVTFLFIKSFRPVILQMLGPCLYSSAMKRNLHFIYSAQSRLENESIRIGQTVNHLFVPPRPRRGSKRCLYPFSSLSWWFAANQTKMVCFPA